MNRQSYPSSCRSIGVAMGSRRQRRGYFIHIPPPSLASSAERTSLSTRAMRSVTHSFASRPLDMTLRKKSDVTPSLIMSRVESASGAKYSAHNEQARQFEPIAPVGTNYTPVGKVDIAAIRSAAAPTAPKPVVPSASRPFAATLGPQSSSGKTVRDSAVSGAAAAARVPEGTWDAPKLTVSAAPPPPPAAPRPFPTVVGNTLSVPAHSATGPSPNVLTKPSEEDRISPVVSLTVLSAPRTTI